MAVTFQTVINRARLQWNDADKIRYPDEDAIVWANEGINAMLLVRPDLFFGSLSTLNTDGGYVLPDALPFNTAYTQVFEDWLTFRAEYGEDENHNSGRAASAKGFFEARMLA